jgi:hypothetical protein
MNMKKKTGPVLLVLFLLLLAGLFVPLGSYTTHSGCQVDPQPKQRLLLIKGESLNKIKKDDNGPQNPLAGCAANTKYILFLF